MYAKRAGKLLLVEDEHVLRGLIAQFLRAEGFDVIEAADGQQAVALYATEQSYDVVLLDLNLPIICGVDVCRRIKMMNPSQPVMICSAAILDCDIEVLQSLDVDRFLTKPYHPLDLLAGIDAEMRRTRQPFSSGVGPLFGSPGESIRPIESELPASQTLVK
jgi:DNA-binding response OmpR family regulator